MWSEGELPAVFTISVRSDWLTTSGFTQQLRVSFRHPDRWSGRRPHQGAGGVAVEAQTASEVTAQRFPEGVALDLTV